MYSLISTLMGRACTAAKAAYHAAAIKGCKD